MATYIVPASKTVTAKAPAPRKGRKGKARGKKKHHISRNIVPNIKLVKLPYDSGVISITATSGVPGYHLFNGTDMYDVDRSGVGHQCMGRDQWTAFYEYYRVLGVGIQIYAFNTTDDNPIIVSCGSLPGTAGTADGDNARESARFETKFGGNNHSVCKLNRYWPCEKLFGITKLQYNADRAYGASTGSAPATPACIQIWAGPLDMATTTTIKMVVRLQYYVRYSMPKILAQS